MEEIKINDYIKTKSGNIYKVRSITKFSDGDIHIAVKEQTIFLRPNEIAKHSKNIKELVQAGDFINGMQVDEFDDEEGTVLGIPVYEDGLFNTLNFYVPIESINIKTILTKEKFENECYKVEE
ncbi:MAG: hypothetical protein HFJ20_03295 [Clostridia bacterium]|nr:hypothetical protein [Clostridia bacterium]